MRKTQRRIGYEKPNTFERGSYCLLNFCFNFISYRNAIIMQLIKLNTARGFERGERLLQVAYQVSA